MGFPTLISDTTLSVIIGGRTHQTTKDNPAFKQIIEALNDPLTTADALVELFQPVQAISRQVQGHGQISVENGQLYFEGEPVDTTLAEKILELVSIGLDIDPWIKFAENVYANPFQESRDELYTFLERANLPITEDGCFIAYKKVDANYRDCHSGTFDNSVGQILEMAREDVDSNRNNHCSHGFHFCSETYLRHFGGSHVMLVKINPKDVVSIPTDYDFAKGRTCRYAVVGEIDETAIADHEWDPVYIDFDVTLVDPEPEIEEEPEAPTHRSQVFDVQGLYPEHATGNISKAVDAGYSFIRGRSNRTDFFDRTLENVYPVDNARWGGELVVKWSDLIDDVTVPATAPKRKTKVSKRAITIETAALGTLSLKEFKKEVANHGGSMAAWAKSLGLPSSTVRNWYADLKREKARREQG